MRKGTTYWQFCEDVVGALDVDGRWESTLYIMDAVLRMWGGILCLRLTVSIKPTPLFFSKWNPVLCYPAKFLSLWVCWAGFPCLVSASVIELMIASYIRTMYFFALFAAFLNLCSLLFTAVIFSWDLASQHILSIYLLSYYLVFAKYIIEYCIELVDPG